MQAEASVSEQKTKTFTFIAALSFRFCILVYFYPIDNSTTQNRSINLYGTVYFPDEEKRGIESDGASHDPECEAEEGRVAEVE